MRSSRDVRWHEERDRCERYFHQQWGRIEAWESAVTKRLAPHRERLLRAASWLVPLMVYVCFVSSEIAVADDPELLTAIVNFGVPHPSGYPLLLMLGQLAKLIPFVTHHWGTTFVVSVIPGAITAWLLWEVLRSIRVRGATALIISLAYGLGDRAMYQCTRVEVYALHGMLLIASIYALMRFADTKRERWLYASVAAVCLGLANHLTMVFMVPVVVLFGFSVSARTLGRPKVIASCLGIAALCAALYGILPLAALYQHEHVTSPSWNDVRGVEAFIHHVTGAEYSRHRGTVDLIAGIDTIGTDLQKTYFPGIGLLAILGLIEIVVRRRWRVGGATLLFCAAMMSYVSSYDINDISTYYPAAILMVMIWVGVGLEWLTQARFMERERMGRWLERALFLLGIIGCVILVVRSRATIYDEQYGGDMSAQAMRVMPHKAIIFTDVDRHTFTMWYQAYVEHRESEVVPVSTSLFSSRDRLWYRDFLRRRHPSITWPTEEESGPGWREWLMEHNPDVPFFAFPWKRWKSRGTTVRNRGWVHEIVDISEGAASPGHEEIRYHYMAEHDRMRGRHVFWNSEESYRAGKELTCVVSWYDDHEDVTGSWTYEGPQGQKVEYPSHNVPPDATLSWEYLPPEDQVAGDWRCTVRFPGMEPMVTEFTIE